MSLCGLGISCEPAPCPHGKDSRREQCHLCELQKQISSLTVQIAAHHEFKLNKLDRKFDDVISELKAWDEDFDYLDSLKLPKKIEMLEKQIANWEEEFYFLKEKLRSPDKKPHKCPICEGSQVRTYLDMNIDPTIHSINPITKVRKDNCHGCEGSGIVWG